MNTKSLSLALLLLIGTTAFAGFEPALEFMVNGNPWDGGALEPSDIVTVLFVDHGDTAAPGPFSTFSIIVCNVDYIADSFASYLPPDICVSPLQVYLSSDCLEISGNPCFGPTAPKPPDGVLFSFDVHVPDDLLPGDEVEIIVTGAYGGIDVSPLSTSLPVYVECDCRGDITDTTSVGPPDGKVDTGDMAALLTALVVYGDPNDNYRVIGAPNQELLIKCANWTDILIWPPPPIVDTGDMAHLLTHLILNGNPANNYEAPCVP